MELSPARAKHDVASLQPASPATVPPAIAAANARAIPLGAAPSGAAPEQWETIFGDLGVRNETWTAQKKYEPRSPTYVGMQKYTSADAWCGYSVIAPPNLNGQVGTFSVYVQQACEGSFFSSA